MMISRLLTGLQAAFSVGKGRPIALVILLFLTFANLTSEWPANLPEGSFSANLEPVLGRPFQSARKTLFDGYLRGNPRTAASQPVTIVEIDEPSLAAVGQWPWPRNKLATLIDAINHHRPAAIGLDVYMPEPDQTSPGVVADNLPAAAREVAQKLRRLPGHETILAESLERAPVVLGAAGFGNAAVTTAKSLRSVPIAVIEGDPLHFVRRFENVLASLSVLQQAARGQALLNAELDHGVVRRIPLIMGLGDHLIPSLAMEMLRVARNAKAIEAYADLNGMRKLAVAEIQVPTQRNGEVWLHFAHIEDTMARYVSAKDVLDEKVDPARLKDKIVLVGLTGVGLNELKTTALGDLVPGIEIHAQMIEAMVDGQILLRPYWVKWSETMFILVFGLFMVWYVPRTESRLATFLRNVPRASIVLGLVLNGIILSMGFAVFSQTGLLIDAAAVFITLSATMGSLISSAMLEIDSKAKQVEALRQEQRVDDAYQAGLAASGNAAPNPAAAQDNPDHAVEGEALAAAQVRLAAIRKAEAAAKTRAEADHSADAAAADRTAADSEVVRAVAGQGPQRGAWQLLAATAVALAAGIGTGVWLSQPPTVPVRAVVDDPGVPRLHLDDRLANPPEAPRAVARDQPL